MLPIFTDAGTRLAHTYNGLTLNSPTDDAVDTYEINASAATPVLDSISDPHPEGDGLEAYAVRKIRAIVAIDGTLRAPTIAKLYDKIKALQAAFDPAKVSHENPTTQGFLAYDFSVPTTDTTTYSTGLVPSRYYARARLIALPPDSEYQGMAGFFHIELELADPRRYEQTAATLTGAGTATNRGDYRSPATVVITMAGAGNAAYALVRASALDATRTLVLNLSSLSNTDVVTIDMAAKRIQLTHSSATTERPDLWVSGDFWDVEPGANTVTITNGTNATTVFTWRHAYCI